MSRDVILSRVRANQPKAVALPDVPLFDGVLQDFKTNLERMGGVTGYLDAAALCKAYHTPLSTHLFMEVSCHLLAAQPHGIILEHMAWWQELYDQPLTVADGHVVIPQRPGIGLRLDPRTLARFKA